MATGWREVASPNTRLDEKDLPELLRVLHPARIEYNSFGLQIGVGVGEIACIEQTHKDPRHCLREILTARLKKSEPLTWNGIVAALREECVGLGKIADDIREKYAHLFTPTISMASEYEHGNQFDKVIREADSEDDEKETCRQRHERISEQDSDGEVGGREKRTQPLRKRESKHETKSKDILSIKKKSPGGDHRARVSKERERSSEYEGIETVRSMKHVQEVESENEEGSVLSRKEKGKKGKRKGGKPAHDKEKQVHGKERAKRMNKKEKFMKDESHSEPEEVREMSKQKKKATHDKEESVSDHNHYSDSEVCRKRVKKGSRKRDVDIESESEASSDEEEMQRSSLEDDTSHKDSAKRKPVTKHTEMKVKVQKEHREDRKDKKDAKSRYSDEEVSTKATQKLRKSKKFETESEESSSASSSDEEEIRVPKHTDNSKHTETKSVAHSKDTTHYESEEKGKISGKKRVSLKLQSTTAVSPCPELYKDKRRKKEIKVGKSVDSSKETYHKTSSKHPRNQREDQEEKKEVVSGKKGSAAPPLERDLPSSEMAETDSGDGESDESSEDEEQKFSDEKEETDCSPADEKEEKGKIMSRHIKEKDQEEKKEVVSAKKETPPCLERDLPSSEMAETNSGDGESDESSEDENESEQQSSDEEEETENDDSSSVEEKEKKRSEESRKSEQKASTPTTTTEMRKTKSQDDDENSKQKKSSKALSKDDYKEGSDPGGSRNQEDQPKKRNRRRHRERSKTPIVRGGSSPSSSQEERKKRIKRGRDHKKKSDRKKKGKGDKDGASGTDDSSPECDMVNQSEVEKKELASVFERFYGKLCCVEFNPKIIAAQLQEKALISKVVMKEMIISPESQQAKILTLIDALDEMIKSHPECFFPCIEVMLKNMDLQELGTRMLSEAGKQYHLLCA